jgi:hypothetical protein
LAGSQEDGGRLVVAGGDAAEVLEAAEHALNGIAAVVEERAEAALPERFRFGAMLGTAPWFWIC